MSTLTAHFTLDEMTGSEVAARRGFDNTPTGDVAANLYRVCSDLMEPIRAHFAAPVRVSSGYRSPQVNAAVGGAPSSAHVEGRACDFTIPAFTLREVYDWIAGSDLPYDQLIFEYGAWIHVGVARAGEKPRRECLMKLTGRGYEPYDPGRSEP